MKKILKKYYNIIKLLFKYFFKLIVIITDYPKLGFSVIFISGLLTHIFLYNNNILRAIYNTIALFAMDIRVDTKDNIIYFIAICASIYTILTLIKTFSKDIIEKLTVSINQLENNYILVVGLGEKGTHFINSLLDNHKNKKYDITVIEKNSNNRYLEKYKEKDVGIIIGDGSDVELLKNLNINNAKNIVLLAGRDIDNFEIALAVQEAIGKVNTSEKNYLYQNLYIHFNEKNLYKFYSEGGLLSNTPNLPIKIFSVAENSAKALFLDHYIDGDNRKYIDSDKTFSIVVLGDTQLALEVIKQACAIAHLPNENHMNIYCIDQNIENLQNAILERYKYIQDIPNITLLYKKLNWRTKSFYEDRLWRNDITNIVLCDKYAQNNLDIASQLLDETYLKESQLGILKCKIHIAVYENEKIAQSFKSNKNKYKNCNTFALTKDMVSGDSVLEPTYENIAKAIHVGYGESYDPHIQVELQEMNTKWLNNAELTDRESNYAQAYHLPLKLKALGLKMVSSSSAVNVKDLRIRFEKMAKNLQKDRKKLDLLEEFLINNTKDFYHRGRERTFQYFPVKFETLFEKLIRAEHNRWCAHHYLKGWEFSEITNKSLKKHNCLVPLDKFPNDLKHTVLYDMYSILYIPNYLAQAKKSIEPYPNSELIIGVIGHSKLLNTEQMLIKTIESELQVLKKEYKLTRIISPLSHAADRIVVKLLLKNEDEPKLIVPLPFNRSEYEKDFSNENVKEFNEILETALSSYAVDSLDRTSKDICYFNVGKEVVDNCDLLIAMWDDKETNGVGGTGDVVAYAKECKKDILHINPETLKVNKINF